MKVNVHDVWCNKLPERNVEVILKYCFGFKIVKTNQERNWEYCLQISKTDFVDFLRDLDEEKRYVVNINNNGHVEVEIYNTYRE